MRSINLRETMSRPAAKLFFRDENASGIPGVLLLHGLGSNSSSWQLQVPLLIGRGFRPIAPDIPGFSQSPFMEKRWSIKTAAGSIADLLCSLDVKPLFVVGISMGGTIALQLTLDYPSLVDKLILVSTFAKLQPGTLKGWFYYLQRAVLVMGQGIGSQSQVVAQRIFPYPDQVQYRAELIAQILQADPRVYRQAMRSLGTFNVEKKLKEIHVPTLVVTGEEDTTVPVVNQCALAERIPVARQIILPKAGHALIIDQAQRFNEILLDFIG